MTGDPRSGDPQGDAEARNAAPVDFDRLDLVRDRLRGDERFTAIDRRPEFAPDRLVCTYDPGLYPTSVTDARLEIVWFENDDFSIHFPGPDAPVPGKDASHPRDWRDVLSEVLQEIETRQRAFWTD